MVIVIIVVVVSLGGIVALTIIALRSTVERPSAATAGTQVSGLRVVQPTSAHAVSNRASGLKRSGRRASKNTVAPLPSGATVSLDAERQETDIDSVLAALDRDLVGLFPIKRKVEQIASLLLVDRARNKFGLTAPRPNLHMCFTGPPGTGKTTMALRMADLLHRLGYLEKGQLVHAMRDDLVGEFVGHTAPKTKRVLERAMGGVLFIDEAYYLYRVADSKDYGQEVIDILLQVMENNRDNLVVILAGYKDRMEEFFTMNPGMRSRIAHHLDFAPYDLDELVLIGRSMLDELSYRLSPAAEAAFHADVQRQMSEPGFANARSVRNNLDQARLRHAHRLAADRGRWWNREELMQLEPPDLVRDDLALTGNADMSGDIDVRYLPGEWR